MIQKLLLCFIIALFSSCSHLPGDSGFKVKGEILPINSRKDTRYNIELYISDSNEFGYSKEVQNPFNTTFTIAPKKNEYYLIIKTIDQAYSYKTKSFIIDGPNTFINPIDLGTIKLELRTGVGENKVP